MTSLVFVFPALGGLLFGYDIGATSGALVSITSQQTSGTDWWAPSHNCNNAHAHANAHVTAAKVAIHIPVKLIHACSLDHA